MEAIWYACVLEMEATADGIIPATHGHQVHGLFFELVGSTCPELAAALHDANRRQPFTLSPLIGLPPPRGPGHPVHAGGRLSFRCTLLNGEIFGGFVGALLGEDAVRAVRLGQVPLRVRRVSTTPAEHPWAGTVRPHRLLANAPALATITLQLSSPTAFSLGNRPGLGKVVEPLPRPELVFGGLLSAWNTFGDAPLDPALRDLVAERVLVSRFRLQSELYQFRNHVQFGAVGQCTYAVKGDVPPESLRALNALADAALYLGVGYRTTMGMGQVRALRSKERRDG
jgi:CRISPR-associated endoribonuclease Cas6